MLSKLNISKMKRGKSFVIKNHIIFILERPVGRVREKPKISDKSSFGANNKKGNRISNDAKINPIVNLISFSLLFFTIRYP